MFVFLFMCLPGLSAAPGKLKMPPYIRIPPWKPPRRIVQAMAAELLLLGASIVNIAFVLLFFFGVRSIPDAAYIYFNVGEFALGAAAFAALAVYLLLTMVELADYCHLIPLAQHTAYHVLAFIVTYHEINSAHTDGDLVAALVFMMGMSVASIGACLTYLHGS